MAGAASRRPFAVTAPARHIPQTMRDAPDRLKNGKILRAACPEFSFPVLLKYTKLYDAFSF
jgi:hypothetical protein